MPLLQRLVHPVRSLKPHEPVPLIWNYLGKMHGAVLLEDDLEALLRHGGGQAAGADFPVLRRAKQDDKRIGVLMTLEMVVELR